MLDSATGDETGRTQEDLEANAFAGLLLMPDQLLHEQILLYGLDKDLVTVDSVLMLMDMFAMPYKAVVLRLFESGNISHQQAEKLLEVGSADVMERVSLTGKANAGSSMAKEQNLLAHSLRKLSITDSMSI